MSVASCARPQRAVDALLRDARGSSSRERPRSRQLAVVERLELVQRLPEQPVVGERLADPRQSPDSRRRRCCQAHKSSCSPSSFPFRSSGTGPAAPPSSSIDRPAGRLLERRAGQSRRRPAACPSGPAARRASRGRPGTSPRPGAAAPTGVNPLLGTGRESRAAVRAAVAVVMSVSFRLRSVLSVSVVVHRKIDPPREPHNAGTGNPAMRFMHGY